MVRNGELIYRITLHPFRRIYQKDGESFPNLSFALLVVLCLLVLQLLFLFHSGHCHQFIVYFLVFRVDEWCSVDLTFMTQNFHSEIINAPNTRTLSLKTKAIAMFRNVDIISNVVPKLILCWFCLFLAQFSSV